VATPTMCPASCSTLARCLAWPGTQGVHGKQLAEICHVSGLAMGLTCLRMQNQQASTDVLYAALRMLLHTHLLRLITHLPHRT
jgi:hypothetical protein